ncbi:hypothetical protein CNYM01_01003 [Colletotrichum nymphaeae SA-01]|uniref:Uncharacterized protein n=1 Tax=Colletotrichum nymphaeae SA-01 TaxID=1460502 RepID=A0A135S963_9PEZI|nr:hypothetical protein CNYM01_01003 [Colletotrichum nymphaeae SA-01]
MVDQGRSRKREVHVHGTGNPKKSQSREDMRAYKLRDFYLGVSADEVSKESAMLQRWIKELQNANPALGRTPTLIGFNFLITIFAAQLAGRGPRPAISEFGNPEEGPNWHQKLGRRHSSSTQAIKNLRLTCRFLNERVSPLLAPVIVVEDTMESVDRLSKFAERPRLRKHIKRIHINFVFYSPMLARDIKLYAASCWKDLAQVMSDASDYRAMDVPGSEPIDDWSRACPFAARKLAQICAGCQRIATADTCEVKFMAMLDHEPLLVKCFVEHQEHVFEQQTRDHFEWAMAVVAALRKFETLPEIVITDGFSQPTAAFLASSPSNRRPLHEIASDESISRLMAHPSIPMSDMNEEDLCASAKTAGLVLDLLRTLDIHEIQPQYLHVNFIPPPTHESFLHNLQLTNGIPPFNKLMQNVRALAITIPEEKNTVDEHGRWRGEGFEEVKDSLRRFFDCLTQAPRLEDLFLGGSGIELPFDEESSETERFLPTWNVSNIILPKAWPCLRKLSIEDIWIEPETLRGFIGNRASRLSLCYVMGRRIDGSTLKMLRKMSSKGRLNVTSLGADGVEINLE